MYRFFKHKDGWRYIEKGQEQSQAIGTYALEGILGVTGTRKVVVDCLQPNGNVVKVTIDNGFITEAKIVKHKSHLGKTAEGHATMHTGQLIEHVAEFYAEAM